MTSQTHATEKIKIVKKNKDMNEISNGANIILNIVFIVAVLITVVPIWVIIVASFTSEHALTTYGYGFWPQEWSVEAYKFLFSKGSIIGTAYKNTIIATVAGTLLCVASVGLYAYPISRPDFRWRKVFTFISFFTQLFTAGTVAFYVTCRQILHIGNSVWALFLPLSFSAYWVLVMRSFYKSNVPDAVIESARIDGANEVRIFAQIVLPISKPILATITLFAGMGYWNEWQKALLYIDDTALYPLQYIIMKLQNQVNFLTSSFGAQALAALGDVTLPTVGIRMATAMVTIGPIVLLYPFLQKYFIKGVVIGAVKE